MGGVGRGVVTAAKRVLEEGTPEEIESIRDGTVGAEPLAKTIVKRRAKKKVAPKTPPFSRISRNKKRSRREAARVNREVSTDRMECKNVTGMNQLRLGHIRAIRLTKG